MQNKIFQNKNVFITGANGGIGRATVEAFAKKGANIIALTTKQNNEFNDFIKTISEKYNILATIKTCDITDFDTLKNIIIDMKKNKQNIDILINNAGILEEALFQMTPISIARKMFEVNFFAPVYLTQMISKLMMTQKDGGAIVNVSSIAGIDGVEGETIYGATKAALSSMTKSLAKELGKYNIRANCVAPGIIRTPLIKNMKPTVLEKEEQNTYLKRLGVPEEIADVITFLASDEARYITGQTLRIDGGKN